MQTNHLTGYPSIDKPWMKYYPADAEKAEVPRKTAYQFVYEKHCDKRRTVALRYFGAKISYGKVFDMVDRIARAFRAMGVKKGDIVTFALPTMPETVYIFYALNKIGAVSNAIDPRLQEAEISRTIEETGSKILIALEMCLPEILPLLETTGLAHIVTLTPTESLAVPARRQRGKQDPRILCWKQFLRGGRAGNRAERY